ncbi:MAG: hypothetical protein J7M20_03305 [Deltaproteobacteria bacterium]|nr:hypothetical protein [Deltaproteobacteria bacterium]
MRDEVKEYLRRLRKDFEKHQGLKNYAEENGNEAGHRFWNLLREDLMRLKPDSLVDYLDNPSSRLAEIKNGDNCFVTDLLDKYKIKDLDDEVKRYWQEALIIFCLEKDVAWKVNKMKTRKATEPRAKGMATEEKNRLKKILQVWGV